MNYFCQNNFELVECYLNQWGDRLPENIGQCDCDYIISYLSTWVIPEYVLKIAKVAAINFHPGSPDYPGIGCTNFALYDNVEEYGVTCHHMFSKIDTGTIISCKYFPVSPMDNMASVISRAYDLQLELFFEIMTVILNGKQLPKTEEQWKRKPFTRKELTELARITPNMSKDEVARVIRATSYKNWLPILKLHGFKFEFKPEQSN